MKTLTILIHAELEVPDDWVLDEHPSGMQVLKVGDRFVDFDLVPLTTTSTAQNAEWSDADAEIVDEVLDAVVGMDVEFKFQTRH